MGNSSGKESRAASGSDSRSSSFRQAVSAGVGEQSAHTHSAGNRPSPHSQYSRGGGRRHDVTFFGLGALSDGLTSEPRRETKQERDARRSERERVARAKERERSLREESVDGGYLVTLGTYTGPEDFSKATVRQLMLERRVAPFWRGLNEHSESWTEHQLVAAARGKPIPAPDEIPSEEQSPTSPIAESSSKPIAMRSQASNNNSGDYSTFFSAGSFGGPRSYSGAASSPTQSSSPLFRGRSKTLASLSSKDDSQTELLPTEIKLPHQPQINGQPIEAYLYKDVSECPICFLYYPPYLNQTRCCDQPICSECFVQIKRPDPHPPEHLDPNSPPSPEVKRQEEEGILISEPAACPFCVQTEFGITYEPPPFRRGLAYANQTSSSSAAMSPPRSSPGNGTGFTRRRGQSVSATDNSVITTDKIRPDWAKKLADARAQAARRSAAASALHTAAYMMGNNGPDARIGVGRRRRQLTNEGSGGDDGSFRGVGATPIPNMDLLMAAIEGQNSSRARRFEGNEDSSGRFSNSRQSRADELEELMMMEAIRQSLAAEEDRKKKEEKDSSKEVKKEEKKKAKEQKKADKVAKKNPLYSSASENGSSILAGPSSSNAAASTPTEEGKGKSKAPPLSDTAPSINTLGFSILDEPTSTLNMEFGSAIGESSSVGTKSKSYSDQSGAKLDADAVPQSNTGQSDSAAPNRRPAGPRQLSDGSSSSSSFVESPPGSVGNELTGCTSSYNPSRNTSGHHLPFGSQSQQETPTPTASSSNVASGESGFNFGSLAAMIGSDDASTKNEVVGSEAQASSQGPSHGATAAATNASNSAA